MAGVVLVGILALVVAFIVSRSSPEREPRQESSEEIKSQEIVVGGPKEPKPSEKPTRSPRKSPPADPAQNARVAMEKAQEGIIRTKSPGDQILELLARARSEREKGNWRQVWLAAEEITKINPDHTEAYLLKGESELELEEFESALSSLKRFWDLSPPQEVPGPDLLLLLVRAHGGIENPDSSQDHIRERALEIYRENHLGDPKFTPLLLELLDRRGDEKNVILLVKKALEKKIDLPIIKDLEKKYFVDLPGERRARAAEILQEARKAAESGDHALVQMKVAEGNRLRPDPGLGIPLPPVFLDLTFLPVRAYLKEKKREEALQCLRQLRDEFPEGEGLIRWKILQGEAMIPDLGTGREVSSPREALENLDSGLDLLEKSSEVRARSRDLALEGRTYRARLNALMGDVEKARIDLEKASRAGDPSLVFHQGETYFLLAEKLKDAGLYRESLKKFGKVLRRRGIDAGMLQHGNHLKGICHLRLGEFQDAIKAFKIAEAGMKEKPEFLVHAGDACAALAGIQGSQKYFAEAARMYQESFRLDPTEKVCLKAARCLRQSRDKAGALRLLNEGSSRFPQSQQIRAFSRMVQVSADTTLLSSAVEEEEVVWWYTTRQPSDNWYKQPYEPAWKKGPAGFGTSGIQNGIVRTEWSSAQIWLWRQFVVRGRNRGNLFLWIYHDDAVEVYLNGSPALKTSVRNGDYQRVPLNKNFPLRPGVNIIAVHCSNVAGTQYVDVGVHQQNE